MSWPETRGPVVADLAGNGRRQLLTATASPSGSARFLASDLTGRELWHHDFERVPGTPPVWNMGGIILWQAGHFTDRRRQDVLVTIRRSMMHSEETLLLSGRDGHELWRRNRQISQRGVGGTPFALADFDGDGLEDAVSLNPSILYILKGANGRDILAKDATWDSVPAKPLGCGLAVFLGTARRQHHVIARYDSANHVADRFDAPVVVHRCEERGPVTLRAGQDEMKAVTDVSQGAVDVADNAGNQSVSHRVKTWNTSAPPCSW